MFHSAPLPVHPISSLGHSETRRETALRPAFIDHMRVGRTARELLLSVPVFLCRAARRRAMDFLEDSPSCDPSKVSRTELWIASLNGPTTSDTHSTCAVPFHLSAADPAAATSDPQPCCSSACFRDDFEPTIVPSPVTDLTYQFSHQRYAHY